MDTTNIILPFFEAKLTRSRPGRGQMLEAEAKILASRPVWPRDLNITVPFDAIVHCCWFQQHIGGWLSATATRHLSIEIDATIFLIGCPATGINHLVHIILSHKKFSANIFALNNSDLPYFALLS